MWYRAAGIRKGLTERAKGIEGLIDEPGGTWKEFSEGRKLVLSGEYGFVK